VSNATPSPGPSPRITVDTTHVDADQARRERFVREGGCAAYWLGDVSQCFYDGCECAGGVTR
jgi:hypothetical protein